MKFAQFLLGSLTVLLLAVACDNSASEAKKIITAYNDAVILAHRTGDTSRLKDVAGEKEAKTLAVLVETKRNAGLVLEATLEPLEVTAVQKNNADTMTVNTRERWRYYDRHLTPGKAPGATINAEMNMEYTCTKVDGVWKVSQLRTVTNKMTK